MVIIITYQVMLNTLKGVFFYMLTVLNLIIMGVITLALIITSYLERKDLTDRLMSKSFMEYKEFKEPIKEEDEIEPINKNQIPLEDAQDYIRNLNEEV